MPAYANSSMNRHRISSTPSNILDDSLKTVNLQPRDFKKGFEITSADIPFNINHMHPYASLYLLIISAPLQNIFINYPNTYFYACQTFY